MIITNPNCSTIGLVCALKPLNDAFGLQSVHVTTLQALSGAGYPGVASLDAVANVIPYISAEEDKLESEPQKLLGRLADQGIEAGEFNVSAQCNRVPVVDGHLLCVSAKFARSPHPVEAADVLRRWKAPDQIRALPSAPDEFIHVFDDNASPQPRRHVDLGKGMTVSVGRIRTCEIFDIRFVVLVHNTIRGAAGGAILNAELALASGVLGPASGDLPGQSAPK
jgi:aspartate-semialdehyde dehydrogenase